jgi:hypothetical protein
MGYQNSELALINAADYEYNKTNERTIKYFEKRGKIQNHLNDLAVEKLDLEILFKEREKIENSIQSAMKAAGYATDAFSAITISITLVNPAISPIALMGGVGLLTLIIGNSIVKLSGETGLTNEALKSFTEDEKKRNTIEAVINTASSIFSAATVGICTLLNPFKSAISTLLNAENIGNVISSAFFAIQTTLNGTRGVVNYDIQKLNKKITLIQTDEEGLKFCLETDENALKNAIDCKETVLKITVFIINNYSTPPKRRR